MHGSAGVLSVASDAHISHAVSGSGGLIPSISCRSTVSDTEYENVSAGVTIEDAIGITKLNALRSNKKKKKINRCF